MNKQNPIFKPVAAPQHAWFSALVPILTQANHILREEYQQYCDGYRFQILSKGDDSPVTQADLRVNQYLMQAIAELTPQIPILSEESDYSQRMHWSKCWLLDPLDGTREFIQKRDKFTINLSLIDQYQTVFSAIAVPHEQVMYFADDIHLPYKYDVEQQQWFQYDPSAKPQRDFLRIATSHGSCGQAYHHYIEHIKQTQPVECVQAGSAYKFCMMLEDLIDLYPRFHPTAEWDTSAGQGLLEQIGGGLLALNAKPFLYNQRPTLLNNGFIAVTDAKLFALAFDALAHVSFDDCGE
ncbi:MAG: 3'(2'),5'-bisphosphate nucleotidase CysQ [Acinetobacter sp.]|nr:3'(2'),5'-bisphosphate nucleotidase CysQ [Acinetobacter sp.]